MQKKRFINNFISLIPAGSIIILSIVFPFAPIWGRSIFLTAFCFISGVFLGHYFQLPWFLFVKKAYEKSQEDNNKSPLK